MAIRLPIPLPQQNVRLIKPDGTPTKEFYDYLKDLDRTIRVLTNQYNTDHP